MATARLTVSTVDWSTRLGDYSSRGGGGGHTRRRVPTLGVTDRAAGSGSSREPAACAIRRGTSSSIRSRGFRREILGSGGNAFGRKTRAFFRGDTVAQAGRRRVELAGSCDRGGPAPLSFNGRSHGARAW